MRQITLQQGFELAMLHHRAGRMADAEALYRQILDQQPHNYDAMHLLGVVAFQRGHYESSLKLIADAISLHYHFPLAHLNLGHTLKALDRTDEAIAAYQHAITLAPNGTACNALGVILREKGQLAGAIEAFQQAITLEPNLAEAHCNLGAAFIDKGRVDDAVNAFRRAIELNHNFALAHSNLGYALKLAGQLDDAVAACRRAIAIQPDYAEAHGNLGLCLTALGQFDEAIAALRQALALRPAFAHALNNLGNALVEKEETEEAIAAYRQAILIEPGHVQAHMNLGSALRSNGQVAEAMAELRQASATGPVNAELHSNLLLTMLYDSDSDARMLAEEHRQWNQRHAVPLAKFVRPHVNDPTPDRRLRVGYMSPDFREHVVGWSILPLLAHHNHEQFEITCYAQVPRPDALTGPIRNLSDSWRSTVGLTDEQLATRIREDRIDILVDLALHTANNRLLVFARKPAPVQVTYLGYCGTTGLDAIDYRLSDPHFDPVDADLTGYSEKTVRLPGTFWCYQPGETPDPAPTPATDNGFVTFGCLNNFAKVSKPTIDLWARIVARVPASRIIIHALGVTGWSELMERMRRQGIGEERVIFVGKQNRIAYLQTYSKIDIALDPFPFNGGITSCDALWMGVPVVTLSGATSVGRGGRSILSNIGLTELIAFTPDQYVEIAVHLANDPAQLRRLRQGMRECMRASPLMDAGKFAINVEAAYRQMWHAWVARTSQPQC